MKSSPFREIVKWTCDIHFGREELCCKVFTLPPYHYHPLHPHHHQPPTHHPPPSYKNILNPIPGCLVLLSFLVQLSCITTVLHRFREVHSVGTASWVPRVLVFSGGSETEGVTVHFTHTEVIMTRVSLKISVHLTNKLNSSSWWRFVCRFCWCRFHCVLFFEHCLLHSQLYLLCFCLFIVVLQPHFFFPLHFCLFLKEPFLLAATTTTIFGHMPIAI